LQGVDAALGGHLVFEQAVHHAVARCLHLGFEFFRCDVDAVGVSDLEVV
jgi:hypothetical protein